MKPIEASFKIHIIHVWFARVSADSGCCWVCLSTVPLVCIHLQTLKHTKATIFHLWWISVPFDAKRTYQSIFAVHLAPQFWAIQRVAVKQGHRKHLPLGPCCELLRIIFFSTLRKAPTLGTCCQLFSIISTVSWGPRVWEAPTFGPCCQLLLWRHLCLSRYTHRGQQTMAWTCLNQEHLPSQVHHSLPTNRTYMITHVFYVYYIYIYKYRII